MDDIWYTLCCKHYSNSSLIKHVLWQFISVHQQHLREHVSNIFLTITKFLTLECDVCGVFRLTGWLSAMAALHHGLAVAERQSISVAGGVGLYSALYVGSPRRWRRREACVWERASVTIVCAADAVPLWEMDGLTKLRLPRPR